MSITLKFDPRFKPMILSGQMRQTIRREQNHSYQLGELLHMETPDGQRFWSVNIKRITKAIIDPENKRLNINGVDRTDSDNFAFLHGFKSFSEMCDYIGGLYGYELFHGVVIGW